MITVMMNMTKIVFNVEELATEIIKSIGIHNIEDNVIPSDVIWDSILEEISDSEYVIYDEVESQLKEKGITIEHW